jgi:DNA-binding NtrC family response regulator
MQRILLVNVHPRSIEPELAGLDIQCDYARNARFATRLAAEHEYLLAIIDHDLSSLNGIQLFLGLKLWQPNMQGILISKHHNLPTVVEAVTAGIGRILPDPFGQGQLRDLIQLELSEETSQAA